MQQVLTIGLQPPGNNHMPQHKGHMPRLYLALHTYLLVASSSQQASSVAL
jgi:hypothetical protein